MKLYFEDLEEGAVFRGDECVVDREEMLEYARKNDPLPFHLDEEAAKSSLFGGANCERWVHPDAVVSIGDPNICGPRVSRWLRLAHQAAFTCASGRYRLHRYHYLEQETIEQAGARLRDRHASSAESGTKRRLHMRSRLDD
jgi:hypothetical protein